MASATYVSSQLSPVERFGLWPAFSGERGCNRLVAKAADFKGSLALQYLCKNGNLCYRFQMMAIKDNRNGGFRPAPVREMGWPEDVPRTGMRQAGIFCLNRV
jgi:hypothetical protein